MNTFFTSEYFSTCIASGSRYMISKRVPHRQLSWQLTTVKRKAITLQELLTKCPCCRGRLFALLHRQRLVEWQQSVVNYAAAAALSASSGKWRRMLCVEKLIANSLQKTSVENVEKWQYKEDTFQKIREATVRFYDSARFKKYGCCAL